MRHEQKGKKAGGWQGFCQFCASSHADIPLPLVLCHVFSGIFMYAFVCVFPNGWDSVCIYGVHAVYGAGVCRV